MGTTYETASGWLDAPFDYPSGGRYASISLGLEPFSAWDSGSLRAELFLTVSSGFRQDRYYEMSEANLSPLFVRNYLIAETGGGFRIFFPFFYNRRLGFGFQTVYIWPMFSSGQWPGWIPSINPYRFSLFLNVFT